MSENIRLLLILIVGAVAGFCEGATGAGWGVFTLAMLVAVDVDPLVAVTSSIFVELILGMINNVAHFQLGAFDFKIAVPLLITGSIAVALGSRVSSKIPETTFRIITGLVIVFFGCIITGKALLSS